MAKVELTVRVSPFIKDYLVGRYNGDYIELGKVDTLCKVIKSHLRKTPTHPSKIQFDFKNCVTLVLPWFDDIDPRTYNYMYPSSMRIIDTWIREVMFYPEFLEYMATSYNDTTGNLSKMIDSFLETRGINLEHISPDTLKKRWYRYRENLVRG
jgi:hypothetical protein